MVKLQNCTQWPWPTFEGQQFKMLIFLKQWELAQKNARNGFKRFGYFPTNDTNAKVSSNDLNLMTLTYFFKVKYFKF